MNGATGVPGEAGSVVKPSSDYPQCLCSVHGGSSPGGSEASSRGSRRRAGQEGGAGEGGVCFRRGHLSGSQSINNRKERGWARGGGGEPESRQREAGRESCLRRLHTGGLERVSAGARQAPHGDPSLLLPPAPSAVSSSDTSWVCFQACACPFGFHGYRTSLDSVPVRGQLALRSMLPHPPLRSIIPGSDFTQSAGSRSV